MAESDARRVTRLQRQQAAVAAFGSFALSRSNLLEVFNEAARVCAGGLDVHFAKVCHYRETEGDLLIVAGFGWGPEVVGHIFSIADTTTPQGRAFVTGEPAVCRNLAEAPGFELPAFYAEYGIVSTIDVVIRGGDQLYGVLEIDSDTQRDYDQHDIDFLTGFANVLGEAVATAARVALLEANVEQMRVLVAEKDRLLDQKKVLAEELQHRVRNNLQLVYGMLSRQLDNTLDKAGKRGLRAIARRVSTLAQVYDSLLGTEMTRTTDFGVYIKGLCVNLADIQGVPREAIRLDCVTEPLPLDLDAVTALGIVAAELVTNSYDHAFPAGEGTITVSLRRNPDTDVATLTIADDGGGFEADPESKRHGLGLVRRLVEQVRGTATIKSTAGTLWTITFPTTPPGSTPMPA